MNGTRATAASRFLRSADRRFGRAMRRLFGTGWGARLAWSLGLQGRLRIESHVFVVPRARPDAPPLRVAFASDFHAGGTTHPALIEQACRAVAEMRADLVLFGGDFVAFDAADVDALVPLLRPIRAPLGKYAVLGNHDLTTDTRHIVDALDSAGVGMLTNTNVRLPAPHRDIWVCGLDDPTFGAPDAERAFDRASGTRLVLMHSPDGLLAIGGRRFALAFCGHTHGGQIALPTGRAVVVPRGRLSRRFAGGTFVLRDESHLLVSHGVGCTSVPVRLFAAPQVHSCMLLPRAAAVVSPGPRRRRANRPSSTPE